jgi:radical SAM-linked protein
VDARPEPAKAVVPEPRQRWRLVVARAADASRLGQRETIDAWESAVEASGLPMARGSGSSVSGPPARPRVAFGAPLAVGMAAEAERIDLFLTERLTRWSVREALDPVLPDGWSLVELEDVWLGGPALGGIVAAADYRVTLERDVDAAALVDACRTLLDARTLPRQREKGGGLVTYDLRPLLVDLAVVDAGPPAVVRMRTRFHPTLGTGRPDEVVAALGDALGRQLTASAIVRERLILADELL